MEHRSELSECGRGGARRGATDAGVTDTAGATDAAGVTDVDAAGRRVRCSWRPRPPRRLPRRLPRQALQRRRPQPPVAAEIAAAEMAGGQGRRVRGRGSGGDNGTASTEASAVSGQCSQDFGLRSSDLPVRCQSVGRAVLESNLMFRSVHSFYYEILSHRHASVSIGCVCGCLCC